MGAPFFPLADLGYSGDDDRTRCLNELDQVLNAPEKYCAIEWLGRWSEPLRALLLACNETSHLGDEDYGDEA